MNGIKNTCMFTLASLICTKLREIDVNRKHPHTAANKNQI